MKLGKLMFAGLLLGISFQSVAQSQPTPVPADLRKEGVTTPKLIRAKDPKYPRSAHHVSGECILIVAVDTSGMPQEAQVTQSATLGLSPENRAAGLGMDASALAAVQAYRFKPAMKNGEPVKVYMRVVVDFHS